MNLFVMWRRPIRSTAVVAIFASTLALVAIGAGPVDAATAPCDRIVWSADGRIVTADADGTDRVEVTTAGASDDPQWSPDGSRLLWRRTMNSSRSQIIVADVDGANEVNASDLAVSNHAPRWSPDGTKIVWSGPQTGVNDGVFVADADGGNRVDIANVSGGPTLTRNLNPVWSPDGTRIAWSATVPGMNPEIFVADVDGTDRVEISSAAAGADPAHNGGPAWSPDGSRIAWSGHDGTSSRVWVADADGMNRVEISSAAGNPAPTRNDEIQWSPDGSKLVWAGDGATGLVREIYVADADGANRVEVSSVGAGNSPYQNQDPQWSPTGSHIVWSGRNADTRIQQIFVADAAGGSRVEISSNGGGTVLRNSFQPQWYSGPDCPGGKPIPGPGGFTDVAADAFYAEAVGWLKAEGITTGTSATTYSPNDTVTRGQMAAFLYRLVGEPSVSSSHGFGDVAAGAFYNDAVAWLKAEGITTGTSGTTYSPNDPVTRGQMAAFLWRLAGSPVGSAAHGFGDVAGGAFYADAVAWLKAQGITTGTSATTYAPDAVVTRGQMAAFLHRMATNSDWTRPA